MRDYKLNLTNTKSPIRMVTLAGRAMLILVGLPLSHDINQDGSLKIVTEDAGSIAILRIIDGQMVIKGGQCLSDE